MNKRDTSKGDDKMKLYQEQIENALKACIDLLQDLQEEGHSIDVDDAFNILVHYHPVTREVGGWYWMWIEQDKCWQLMGR